MAEKTTSKKKTASPFLSEDSEASFKHFSKLVAETPADELEPWNADPEIVRVNLGRGVDAVRPHVDRIVEALPLVSVNELLELPSLALALGFAADRVYTPASPQEIRARQQRLRPVRRMTLGYLEIVAELGLVPRDRVSAIRANTGPIDEARDGVAIVATFGEHAAALAGKHPFTEAALASLAEDGNWLLLQLLPSGAAPGKAQRSDDALARDRLWTEIMRRYDELYQAGIAIWGRRKVDAYIPALQSRAAVARTSGTAEPAPVDAGAAPAPAAGGAGNAGGSVG